MERCDVIVLGVGTCGEDAALRLMRAGLDVVGVEANLIGGECPYWACLPTKSLVRSANLVAESRRANDLVGSVEIETDWSVVAQRLRAEVTGGWDDSYGEQRFSAAGGRLVRGWGHIVAPRTVQVGETFYEAREGILLATGSSPFIPPIPGLSEVGCWTNREAVAAESLPESLAIIGGGPVGVELGQVFARFGVAVSIIEGRDRLLGNEEPEISHLVAAALEADGVELRLDNTVREVALSAGSKIVRLSGGGSVRTEEIMVAAGRTVDAESLGVESMGAEVENGFVKTDELMKAADGLWAIGDVTGEGLLTQVGLYQGSIAVEAILGGDPSPAEYSIMPRAIFTDPEVGAVGLTEAQAHEQGYQTRVVTKDLQSTFRGWLHRTGNEGVIKLVADESEGVLIGASVVGPTASDLLGFLSLAIKSRTPVQELANMIYAFPTFHGAIGEALGAYGRGVVRVLDPETEPMVGDPSPGEG